jgi:hypothetical protein
MQTKGGTMSRIFWALAAVVAVVGGIVTVASVDGNGPAGLVWAIPTAMLTLLFAILAGGRGILQVTSRFLWLLAVVVLLAGVTVMVAAFVGGGEDPGLAVALFGMPAVMLTLFLASLGLIVSRARDTAHIMRWTLLAVVGSVCTPMALILVLAAGGGAAPYPGELPFLIVVLVLGPGAFYVLRREMFPRRDGHREL